MVIPNSLRHTLLKELYRDYPVTSRMQSMARSYVWWTNLDKQIEKQEKSCMSCQAVKQAPAAAPLHPWAWPTKPWQRVHVDFAGHFLGSMYFLAVDACTLQVDRSFQNASDYSN